MAPKSGLSASDKDFEIRGNDRRSFLKLAVGTVVGTASMPLVGLKTDFSLDPLRSDPRFAELVRKLGLPQ